jgi:2-polyprenyl-3-methyl-5-hydroxy-6-metoxy-1,4-benzoquinol methylase
MTTEIFIPICQMISWKHKLTPMKSLLQALLRAFFFVFFRAFGEPEFDSDAKDTISLYAGGGFGALFARIRFWDAPFGEIERMVPKAGQITELGCGDGLLSNYLAISGQRRKVLGIEINRNRLGEAEKGVANAKFVWGDIVKSDLPDSDCILLIDVLHHLYSKEDQEKVLGKAKSKLKKGGKVIVAEIVERPFWKCVFTWFTDVVIVPILFEGKLFTTNIYYRKEKEWELLLKDLGFKVKMVPASAGRPFSHMIYVCSGEMVEGK